MPSTLTCRVEGGVAQVRLDRPDKLNALTLDTLEDLVATARSLPADRTLRAVVIGGEGDSFCAGLDFATVLKNPPRMAAAFVPRPWRGTNLFQEACWAWRRLPVPVDRRGARPLLRRRAPDRARRRPPDRRPPTPSGRCSRAAGASSPT